MHGTAGLAMRSKSTRDRQVCVDRTKGTFVYSQNGSKQVRLSIVGAGPACTGFMGDCFIRGSQQGKEWWHEEEEMGCSSHIRAGLRQQQPLLTLP